MVYHVSRLFLSHLAGEEVVEGGADRGDGGELSDLVPARRDRGRENVRGELELQGHGEVVREDAPRPLQPRVVRRSGSRAAGAAHERDGRGHEPDRDHYRAEA